ncbi:MAG: c-type cytochrome [Bacteriovoracaceae bacterium]|jgi:cytochrome c553|nr:c-type cytochrome [Bacteriovoracaceae bacterium]
MIRPIVTAIILSFMGTANCFSQDAANGKTLYKKCIACHGKAGEGKKSQKAPNIAGQYDWYIVKAITDMKAGKRKNLKMLPFIKKLNEQQIKDLAAYVSSLPWKSSK